MDRSIFIAGTAGEGIQTIGDVIARAFLLHGYSVFATKEYESRIRGGNNSYRIRISDQPCNAPRHRADVLLALNPQAADHYADALSSDGIRLDAEAIPFTKIAEQMTGERIAANTVAAGALCAAVGLPVERLNEVLEETFARKGEDIVKKNLAAARAGFDQAQALSSAPLPGQQGTGPNPSYVGAHEIIPIAAAAAGCRFMAAYPMSPSTGIITALSRDPELGVLVEQVEDEISAINMAIGASAAGGRAMTATSGGGFALMAEAISLAGMIETPIVVLIAQRPGPATGLPTRTAQEDLLFAVRAGHGEFARAVLAPSDPQDAADLTVRAFELAERYQTPVLLLTDQYLADAHFTLPSLSIPQISDDTPDAGDPAAYLRYRLTEDGVSPRRFLGDPEALVSLDSDEHDEAGHITEDLATTRPAMVEKRLAKARHLAMEIKPPASYRVEDAETVLIGWGSTRGALVEAVDRLRGDGQLIGLLHFTEVWPLPALSFDPKRRYIAVEGNATGQLAGLLRAEYGVPIDTVIGRTDGLPIDAETLVKELT